MRIRPSITRRDASEAVSASIRHCEDQRDEAIQSSHGAASCWIASAFGGHVASLAMAIGSTPAG
jgi:hypothetical protein